MMKKRSLFALLLIVMMSMVVLLACEPEQIDNPFTPTPEPPEFGVEEPLEEIEGMTLTWRDEFGGSRLDPSKWAHEVNGFWYNDEVQYYDEDGASVSDGTLKITAHKDKKTFTRNGTETVRDYGSSRIRTHKNFAQTYGRFEAAIKLPAIRGLWPAFWMMPESDVYGGWSKSGEIDIMEAKGRLPYDMGNALHYANSSGGHIFSSKGYTFPGGGRIDEFHIYRVDWSEEKVDWYVDGIKTFTVEQKTWSTSVSKTQNPIAPFDKEFYMILNLAVGGAYDGGVLPPADFTEASMEVEYVRVWQWDRYL